MSVLSFAPADHGGVSTFGADPPPLAIPISGDIRQSVDGPILAIPNPEYAIKRPARGRTYQRSNSSPPTSRSPSRTPSPIRRTLSTSGNPAVVDVSPLAEPAYSVSNTATDSAEPDIAGAQGTDQCSVKATSVKSLIVQGNETLNKIIGDMQQRITTHKEISERVRAMKEELERLREAANNIPQPATADGIAQRTLAMAAIESCTANMSGMESAVDELVATIELLKQQISEFGETDYNITDTLGIRPPAV